ncbi:hypothetical protein BVG19_g5297 [[Candida] boidinii]|nr:hypothetical protein BVG19_g5297 [[Candida] boidinii]OWB53818.1 hypothetical protein B5S27_g5427 [[Candida] boidinii]
MSQLSESTLKLLVAGLIGGSTIFISSYFITNSIKNFEKNKKTGEINFIENFIYSIYEKLSFNPKTGGASNSSPSDTKFPTPVIESVGDDFNYLNAKPYPYRPFKNGEYKMTLSIRKQDPNDFIFVEDTYKHITDIRGKDIDEATDECSACHPSAEPAVRETYDLVTSFLTARYPMHFEKITSDDENEVDIFYNKIRNEKFPFKNDSIKDVKDILRILGRTIEEDILILIKNPDNDQLDEYVLRAGVSIFPAGFNPLEKFNQPLTNIHKPVPYYLQKLQTSMNKFFQRLQVNEFIVRNNWSIQTHTKLRAPSGSHATKDEKVVEIDPKDLDFNKVFLRCEKQSFTRLPISKADLMLIRTYTTPLTQIREEGRGEDLCGAIDGLPADLQIYKRKVFWGEAVKSYLRNETNGATDEVYKYEFTE